MYKTDFEIKKAKYCVTKKWLRLEPEPNHIRKFSVGNWVRYYRRIYTYTVCDLMVFMRQELIEFFNQEGLKDCSVRERRKRLENKLNDYVFNDLPSGEQIKLTIVDPLFGWPEINKNPLSLELFYLVDTLSFYNLEWSMNTYNNCSYPMLDITWKEKKHMWKQRHWHHMKSYGTKTLTPSKAVRIASTDPEYECYLTMRQRNGGCAQINRPCKRNRNNVDGSWKKQHKCQKQWAKHIENPSYEKISKAMWKETFKDKVEE